MDEPIWLTVDGSPNRVRRRCAVCNEWFEVSRSRMTTRGHNPQSRKLCGVACRTAYQTRPLIERFWEKVNRNGPIPEHTPELGLCWLWTGVRYTVGYGQVGLGGRVAGNDGTHRVAWRMATGEEIPDGKMVGHVCDVRHCVRNDSIGIYVVDGVVLPRVGHMFLGTKRDNHADMTAKGRRRNQGTVLTKGPSYVPA